MATTNATTTNVSEFFRIRYGKLDDDLVYKQSQFFMELDKDTSFEGSTYNHTILITDVAGASNTFSSASNGSSPLQNKQFAVAMKPVYSVAGIDRIVIKTAHGGDGSNANALKTTTDSTVRAASNLLAKQLTNAGGALGQVNSTANTQTIPLVNPADVTKFEVGDVLNFASATSGGTLRGGGLTTTIVAVDRNAGTLSGSAYLNANSIALNDWLVPAGVYNNTLKSVGDWIPATAPSVGESFLGIDRSVDSRAYGIIYDATGLSVEDAIINGCAAAAERGGYPDIALMSPRKYAQLQKELGDRKQFTDVKSQDGTVGFRNIVLDDGMRIVRDQWTPDNAIFLLVKSDWQLKSAGPAVTLFDDDVPMLRQSAGDGYELRCGGYSGLLCKAPGHQVRVITGKTPF